MFLSILKFLYRKNNLKKMVRVIKWKKKKRDKTIVLRLTHLYFLWNEPGLAKPLNGLINQQWRLQSLLMLPLCSQIGHGTRYGLLKYLTYWLIIQETLWLELAVPKDVHSCCDATTCLWFQFRYIPHNNGPASDLVTASILMLYGTTENNKIVLFYFLKE